MMTPSLTARALQPVVAGLQALGHPAGRWLRRAGIDRSLLDDPDGRLPHTAMAELWRLAIEGSGDDALGLHIARAAPIESFDVHAYAVLSSTTLRAAYRRVCRYQRLIHDRNELTLEEGAEEGVLRHARPGGGSIARHPAEFLAASWLRFGRLVTGSEWKPSLVCFGHDAPGDPGEHAAFFGPDLRFRAGRTSLHVPNRVLDAPNPGADEGLLRLLDRHASTLLERRTDTDTVSGQVRAWLEEAHGIDGTTAEAAASALAMSPRTLRRNLAAEDTSYRELLEGYRHERAVELLADSRNGIADVAFLLGFSELSAFYRAFRRWTDTTPGEYRKRF